MIRRRLPHLFICLCAITFAGSSSAQGEPTDPGKPSDKAHRAGAAGQRPDFARRPGYPPLGSARGPGGEDVRRLRRDAAEMMKQGRERVMNMSPEERAKMRAQHDKSRVGRRTAKISGLKMRWGAMLRKPEVQAELRVHAERMARLRRMQELAEDHHKEAILDRVFELMKREQGRHMRTMSRLRRGTEPDGPASLPVPSATSPAGPSPAGPSPAGAVESAEPAKAEASKAGAP